MLQQMKSSTQRPAFPSLLIALMGACALEIAMPGCSPNSRNESSSSTPTADGEEPRPSPPDTPGEAPAPPPATRPVTTSPATTQAAAAALKSEYDAAPPYTVKLYVRDPEEKQPGWLRIMEMADENRLSTSVGTFPERNRIYVDTDNVHRLRIHIDQLPLAPKTRIVLHIDDQPMELARKDRNYVYLERQSNGVWTTVPPKKGED